MCDFLIHERWLLALNAADDFYDHNLIRRETARTEEAAASAPGRR